MSVISFSDFQKKYIFDCQLSQGSFGKVCRIQQIKSKKYFALKKITVKKKQQLDDIENEIRILMRFRHPFVVQIKQTYHIQIQSGFGKPIWQVGIILQLAKCSLDQIIRMKKSAGSIEFIMQQIFGLIKILFILQQQNIVHRDIKPANILIFQTIDNKFRWKLADFGLSLNLSQNKETDNFAGSFQYASPKLKRKFKYPNLKIKTNHFKDDVYSLGVTLLQTITGQRNYNNIAYEKIKEACNDRKLVDLIDMMLQQDQQKRPCFKQLMMVIQKDFNISKQLTQIQNKKQLPNYTSQLQYNKIKPFNAYRQDQPQNISDKTVIKNSQTNHNKKIIINTEKPIQCLANLDGAIMCGCDNGQLFFIVNNRIVQCGPIHRRNVSQFFTDQKGDIWSIGGDCVIKKWSKNQLIKALISQVKQIQIKQDRYIKKSTQKTILTLQLKQTYFDTIQVPYPQKCGISCMYAYNEDNFIVGFYNGYVYGRWKGNQYNSQIFSKPITAIKTTADYENIWICSLDGQVKILNTYKLSLLNRFFYRKDYGFVDLHINQNHNQQLITLLTVDGRHVIINGNLQCIYQQTITKKMILSSVENKKNCFILTETGEVIDINQERFVELGSKGWNCLAISVENQLIAGNFFGQVAIFQW